MCTNVCTSLHPHRDTMHLCIWLLARKCTMMWIKVHVNCEQPWLEEEKAYAQHALTGQLAWGNTIMRLEEEWELNQYKSEKTWKGKPASGPTRSKGDTEGRPWSGIIRCTLGCSLLITPKEKTLCCRSMNYCFQLLMAVTGSFLTSRPELGKIRVISPEACCLTRWFPLGSSEQSILAAKFSQTRVPVLL